MKIVKLTVIAIVFLVLVLPGILSIAIKDIPDRLQPSLNATQKIYGSVTLSQTFIASLDNLSQIGTSIKNPNFANKKDLIVSIYDSNNQILRTIVLNGKGIPDGDFIKLKFDPIASSKNKIFTMVFSAPSANNDDALEIFLTDEDTAGVDLAKVGEKERGEVSFVSFFRPPNLFGPMFKIYSDWLTNLVSDLPFFIFYVLLILSLLGYLVLA